MILIGAEKFSSKASVQRRAQLILRDVPVGTVLDGQDLAFVLALLSLHPRSAEKVGAGVASVLVHLGQHNRSGFWIRRIDGTGTDFSYMKCLGIKTARSDVLKAFRYGIADQVLQVREEALRGLPTFMCPVDLVFVPANETHVDHEPPNTFQFLVERFLHREALTLLEVPITGGGDGSMDKWLADKSMAQRWSDFHLQHAKLRLISRAANLRRV